MKILKDEGDEMNHIIINDIVIGKGKPKICIPIVGKTEEVIYSEAEQLKVLPVDLVEWRVDYFEEPRDIEKILHVLSGLKYILGDIPLIFTIRTKVEGGETAYYPEVYKAIIRAVIQTGLVELVDVELSKGDEVMREIVKEAQREDCYVIASSHDFEKTPSKEEIIARLMHMQNLGADILKMAVMPQNGKDVITLLDATREMVEEIATKPVVTMSMSKVGCLSRISGEVFGSAITFGVGEHASAPGQIKAKDLAYILDILH